MKKDCYKKGSMLTFPLELTELDSDSYFSNKEYLYPKEVMEIQEVVEEFCDRMEYDGSLMYDEYPDKVSVERITRQICGDKKCQGKKGINPGWMKALAQILLWNEMSFRRERRRRHKNRCEKDHGSSSF